VKRQRGSHRVLRRYAWPDYVFAFHDRDEVFPERLALLAKQTGLTPEDL
jgi:predicted RNA binding protein YcfA (HicA-like mRNA interferase family)